MGDTCIQVAFTTPRRSEVSGAYQKGWLTPCLSDIPLLKNGSVTTAQHRYVTATQTDIVLLPYVLPYDITRIMT